MNRVIINLSIDFCISGNNDSNCVPYKRVENEAKWNSKRDIKLIKQNVQFAPIENWVYRVRLKKGGGGFTT